MPLKLCVAYTLVAGGPKTTDFVARFVSTWKQFGPGVKTDVVALCNGGGPDTEQAVMLSAIGAKCVIGSNVGWDIGSHIRASKGPLLDYDMVFYCGESVHFWKEGWMKRLSDSYSKWGASMLGLYGTHVARAHLQTTAFATSPKLLREYGLPVTDRASRYEFEHGERAFWKIVSKKFPVRLVTWQGDYPPGQWRIPNNVIWKGDQSACLAWCNHTEMYKNSDSKRKRMWQQSADRPYK